MSCGLDRPVGDLLRAMDRAAFVDEFGGVFEHSPWVAADAFDAGLEGVETLADLLDALCAAMRAAPAERRLALIRAHPDLSGKARVLEGLSAESKAEQRSAGLDRCSPEEFARLSTLNDAYTAKFGFPFVMAVKGRKRDEILAAMAERLENTPEAEQRTAIDEIARIAALRLAEMTLAGAEREGDG